MISVSFISSQISIYRDATSPAHGGFKEWSGKESLWQQIKHVSKELF
jgi:hypothetical protein